MSLDLETPLALSTFLANNTNHRKVIIPSTFNMSRILKSLKAQEPHYLVVDQDFYELDVPESVADEYRNFAHKIKKIIVAGNKDKKLG